MRPNTWEREWQRLVLWQLWQYLLLSLNVTGNHQPLNYLDVSEWEITVCHFKETQNYTRNWDVSSGLVRNAKRLKSKFKNQITGTFEWKCLSNIFVEKYHLACVDKKIWMLQSTLCHYRGEQSKLESLRERNTMPKSTQTKMICRHSAKTLVLRQCLLQSLGEYCFMHPLPYTVCGFKWIAVTQLGTSIQLKYNSINNQISERPKALSPFVDLGLSSTAFVKTWFIVWTVILVGKKRPIFCRSEKNVLFPNVSVNGFSGMQMLLFVNVVL